jgi:ATP-binding cassette subfamily B protein
VQSANGIAVLAHPSRRQAWRKYDPTWSAALLGIEVWNRKTDGWAPSHAALRLITETRSLPFVGMDFHDRNQLFPLTMSLEISLAVDEGSVLQGLREGRGHAAQQRSYSGQSSQPCHAFLPDAIAAAGLSLALESRVTSKLYEFYYKETPEERERGYIGDLLVQPRTTKEIRAYVLADYLLERHSNLSESLYRQRALMYRSGTRVSIITGIVTGTTLAFAYLFVSIKGVEGLIDPGGVVLVIGAFTSVSSTLAQISSTFVSVDQHTTFLDDYFSFLSIDELVKKVDKPETLPAKLDKGIVFNNVSFKYPGGTEDAVRDFNLAINNGELIALVGENGAGKSTIVRLLLRFYDVDSGSINIGGVDLKNTDPEELRNRIGVLFQDYANYELTVRENVTMGRPNAEVLDDRVLESLRDARSEWLVKKMPNGLDSKVGRLFEGGHDLSGGEWQRLALARIMYRDADIWILDEPTSSLDPEAEAAIFAELKENLKGRIGIVISHRFSTVRIADRIAVIVDGKVSEFGSHQDLMKAGGRYSQLFELQAAGYR